MISSCLFQYPGELGQASTVFVQSCSDHSPPQHGAGSGGYSCAKNLTSSHHKQDDSPFIPYLIKDDSTPVLETGIRIQSRQPENGPNSVNHATQGTASRRIRLGLELGSNSIEQEKSENRNSTEEQGSQSLISVVSSVNCLKYYIYVTSILLSLQQLKCNYGLVATFAYQLKNPDNFLRETM